MKLDTIKDYINRLRAIAYKVGNTDIIRNTNISSNFAKCVYSLLIIIIVPVVNLPDGYWEKFVLNYKIVFFLFLYFMGVISTILLIFGVKGLKLTSEETDKKIFGINKK